MLMIGFCCAFNHTVNLLSADVPHFPFRIIRVIRFVAYVANITSRCYNPSGFPWNTTSVPPLSPLLTDTRLALTPLHIVGRRTVRHGSKDHHQLLVQWTMSITPEDEVTWEDEESFWDSYPRSNLEDKVESR